MLNRRKALHHFGNPEIFNNDPGCQFTSDSFTQVLKDADIQISMDGKGRWVDNVFIERLWRSFKHEEFYLNAYENLPHAPTDSRVDGVPQPEEETPIP
ncbi:MAG: hypothetical protein JNK74_16335 [Candidatus Hydrogenedentes bacterium]|nr:hypothetical protein [Candidatus Hydrogenedentota bacterium]